MFPVYRYSADCNKWQYESIINGKRRAYKKEERPFITHNTMTSGTDVQKKKKRTEIYPFLFWFVKEVCIAKKNTAPDRDRENEWYLFSFLSYFQIQTKEYKIQKTENKTIKYTK